MLTIKDLFQKIKFRNSWTQFYYFIFAVTLFKIILMALFSSDYENKLFIPFVENYILNNDINPYDDFLDDNGIVAFPYPPLMLFIEYLSVYFINTLGIAGNIIGNIMCKVPLLFFDFLGMFFLMKLYPRNRKYIGILYFASPIILYSTYMHGQLDIIPTTLIVGAIYYFLKHDLSSTIITSIFLAAALMTKLHILAVIPLMAVYLAKKNEWKKLLNISACVLCISFLVILPFYSDNFVTSVLFNREQAMLTKVYISFVDLKLYLPVLVLLGIYIQSYVLRDMNKDLLVSIVGLIFSVFLILVPPMPGWYVWVVPFITAFFINVMNNRNLVLNMYVFFNAIYLVYFLTAHHSSYVDLYFMGNDLSFLKSSNEIYCNIMFTVLAGTLLYIVYDMYNYGVASNAFYRRKGMPFAIGIAGDSGTGKSTMLTIIEECFGKNNILQIEGDGDHRWERGADEWNTFTHLNPKANYIYRQAKDIAQLKKGASIHRVEYDHDTGKFTEPHRITPRKYIVLSGLHAFYLPQMRRVFDLKIYMDTDEILRRFWKIKRDTSKRGYSFEKILEQIEVRIPDTLQYITPQRAYADLIVSYFDKNLKDCCDMEHEVELSLKFTLSSSVDVEPLMVSLSRYGINIEHDFSQDLEQQSVIFYGNDLNLVKIDFNEVAENMMPHLDELTTENIKVENNRNGVIQMMLLLIVSHKMQIM